MPKSGIYWVKGSPRALGKRLKQHEKEVISRMNNEYERIAWEMLPLLHALAGWQNVSGAARASLQVNVDSYAGYYWDIKVYHDMSIFWPIALDYYKRKKNYLPYLRKRFNHQNQFRSALHRRLKEATVEQWSR